MYFRKVCTNMLKKYIWPQLVCDLGPLINQKLSPGEFHEIHSFTFLAWLLLVFPGNFPEYLKVSLLPASSPSARPFPVEL